MKYFSFLKILEMATNTISNIVFGVSSSEEIRKDSVLEIKNPRLGEAESLYDERLGADTDKNIPCGTCGLIRECHGHFGHISLPHKMLNPMFYRTVANLLKCFCKKCHSILSTAETLEISNMLKYKGSKRFEKILKLLEKINKCGNCKAPQPKVVFKTKDSSIIFEYDKKEKKIIYLLTVDEMFEIFDDVSDEDVAILGFNPKFFHPRNLIMSEIPVIPTCSRPRVIKDGGIGDDDLTTSYNDILKIVKIIEKMQEDKPSAKDKKKYQDDYAKELKRLKVKIETMFDNSTGKKSNNEKRIMKDIKHRIGAKDGIVRMHISGKRNDFTARTVIGADPFLKVDQVGIPRMFADILTFPEHAHKGNIEYLSRLLDEGKVVSIIRKSDGKTYHMKYWSCIVGTQVLYGDIIIQPNIKWNNTSTIPSPLPFGWEKILVTTREIRKGERIIRNGKLIDVKYPQKRKFKIEEGDIIERKLQNGDRVILNRQPTLWIAGMQGMEVVITNNLTMQMNLGITKGFNAD